MAPPRLSLTFLGTCSGGGPLVNRAWSSACLSVDGKLWLIDCGEGTLMQFMKAGLKTSDISKIFITHCHADHSLGIVPLLYNAMTSASGSNRTDLRVQVYGPSGIRELIRTTLRITQTILNGYYAVHELLTREDMPYPCPTNGMHQNEYAGKDIYCSADGFWREFETAGGLSMDAGPISHRMFCLGYVFKEPPVATSSTSDSSTFDRKSYLEHINRNRDVLIHEKGIKDPTSLIDLLLSTRVPIILPDGHVLSPPPPPLASFPSSTLGRKIVVLGDTHDPWRMRELCMDASLLVHEATNAFIHHSKLQEFKPGYTWCGNSEEKVRERAMSRGHSTPVMAGDFAHAIRARRLVLNHFSAKFAPPPPPSEAFKRGGGWFGLTRHEQGLANIMFEIERQATTSWQRSSPATTHNPPLQQWGTAIAAYDFMTIEIAEHEMTTEWRHEVGEINWN
ncbi:hypothetical protein FRB94_008627 [Tulasnella sp. JGI-2019a]|nr:hypothetical protein FRB94_008627 [Tulasnella sp. JGI-2019a]